MSLLKTIADQLQASEVYIEVGQYDLRSEIETAASAFEELTEKVTKLEVEIATQQSIIRELESNAERRNEEIEELNDTIITLENTIGDLSA